MSDVFQNIDPPPPSPPGEYVPPPLVRGEDTLAGWRGEWWVNILEDAGHSSVLYICKYFVLQPQPGRAEISALKLLTYMKANLTFSCPFGFWKRMSDLGYNIAL
jgi:hypothetical protein